MQSEGLTSLGQRARSGLGWSLLNNVITRLGTLLTGLVLARLLTPADYGVYAVALVVLMVLLSLNEMGVSLAIVRWEGEVRAIAPTVMTIAIATSTALYAACWFLAPLIASGMGAPAAVPVLRVLCLSVVIDGIVCVPAGLLTREFAQGRRLIADAANFGLGTVVTLALAATGSGAMSLAWGRLAGNLLALVMIARLAPYLPRPGFDRAVAASLVRYGLPLAGSSLLVLSMLNVDYVIVGSMLGPTALGLYLLAFNLSSWPVNAFSEAARRVSFAGFSRLVEQGREPLAAGFTHSLALLMAATLPVCALLVLFAEPLVVVLYGERWREAAQALTLLAGLGAIRVALELAYDCLVAADRARVVIGLQGLWLAVLIPTLALGAARGGLRGVGAAHVLVAALIMLPAFLHALRPLGITGRQLLASNVRSLLGVCAMVPVGLLCVSLLEQGPLLIVVGGISCLLVYVPIVLPLRHLIPPRNGASGQPEPQLPAPAGA